MLQALVKELQSGNLPLIRANGPFGCADGQKWGSHQVMVIIAGGIGVCSQCLMQTCCGPISSVSMSVDVLKCFSNFHASFFPAVGFRS